MASTRGSMKGFFRQKKKDIGIAKPSAAGKSKKKSPIKAAVAADLATEVSLDLKDQHENHEEVLRQFDMNMAYGPCLGMTRLGRWERASRLGLNPPADIEALLKCGKAEPECLWNGRV